MDSEASSAPTWADSMNIFLLIPVHCDLLTFLAHFVLLQVAHLNSGVLELLQSLGLTNWR